MSLGYNPLNSLSSQKRGTVYSLVLLVAALALVVGIIYVLATSGPTVPQQFTPRWVQASSTNNASLNFTFTNTAGASTSIQRVDIARPSSVALITCGQFPTPSWDCSVVSATTISFQNAGALAGGSSIVLNINVTPPAGGGNYSFSVTSFETTGGGGETNTTGRVNVSVDADKPTIRLLNISAAAKNISELADFDTLASIFLNNASGGVKIAVQVLDNSSLVGNVTLIYNYTSIDNVPLTTQVPSQTYFTSGPANFSAPAMLNSTADPNIFTYTFPTTTFLNGSKVFFSILANDTVGNGNISNKTPTVGWNFTIDTAAPIILRTLFLNDTSVNTSAMNTTATSRTGLEYIINSTVVTNVTIRVSDDGGVGTIAAAVMNRSGGFLSMNLNNGTNGSSRTGWVISSNISNLINDSYTTPGAGFNGDGLYNITFRVTDNVSNVRYVNYTVEVDDTPPKGIVLGAFNLTSPSGLVTNSTTNNASLMLSLVISVLADNNTRSVTATGNKGNTISNNGNTTMTQAGGATAGTSTWNVTIANETTTNLSSVCDVTNADGQQCNLNFAIKDVMDRVNQSMNLTLFIDTQASAITVRSPAAQTTNYSTSVLVNISIDDTVGPVRNASFKWVNETHNSTNFGLYFLQGSNVGNNTHGTWNATLDITSLADGNYTLEFNVTDTAGNRNASVFVSNVVFDSSRPTNFTFFSSDGNAFRNGNFTTSMNVTETTSGLRNVSFRLENSTLNFSWIEANATVNALGIRQFFSPARFNLTHWDNIPLNATNGNFSVRVNVTDTAGNQNTSVTVNFTVDTVVPTITLQFPAQMRNQTANFTVNATVTESNINSVAYRWINDSSGNNAGGHRSEWQNMTDGLFATAFNASFNWMDGGGGNLSFLDGNYTIQVMITDKVGNVANTSIALILDKNQPLIASPVAATFTDTNQTGSFVINLTINDTGIWNKNLGNINTTNINGSAYRLENATFNSSWFGMAFYTVDQTSTDANRTNATVSNTSVPNGLYNLRFMVNDTAGNTNNSVRINRVMIDNVAPGVALSVTNLTPSPSGGSGVAGTLQFNASITDNLPVNISISGGSNISTQSNKFGVFYRFESSSVTTPWLPMGYQTGMTTSAQPHNVVFNASNATSTLADGDYVLRINATDSAGNQNTSVSVSITIQNTGTGAVLSNQTIQGGFFNGNLVNVSSPTFIVNTSVNATCLYALDQPSLTTWNLLGGLGSSRAMSNNGSAQHNVALGSMLDKASYTLRYVCRSRDGGNYTSPNDGSVGAATTLAFGVDTRSNFNVTIPGKTDGTWPNYFQPASAGSNNGWTKFSLSQVAIDNGATSLNGTQGGTNVTNVMASLLSGTVAGNFSRLYSHNISTNTWTVFIVGQTGNNFINFTGQDEFWVNVTAVDRIELG